MLTRAKTVLRAALPALVWGTPTLSGQAPATDLFFSEYVEGSGNNKALEIYNGTGRAVSLDGYAVELYSNGNAAPSATLGLAELGGELAHDAVLVLRHAGFEGDAQGAHVSGVANFNGNDAVALRREGRLIDLIGTLGNDASRLANQTLRRRSEINAPAPDFDPEEWVGLPADTLDGLGGHEFAGADAPVPEPSDYPADFQAMARFDGAVELTWVNASGPVAPDGYLLLVGADRIPPLPLDGVEAGGDGTWAVLLAPGDEAYLLSDLAPGTHYRFILVPFTNADERIDYKTDGAVPMTAVLTPVVLFGSTFEEPGEWARIPAGGAGAWETVGGHGSVRANEAGATDAWLLSGPIGFSGGKNGWLQFRARHSADGPEPDARLRVRVSGDFTGSATRAAVEQATWTRVPADLAQGTGGGWRAFGPLPFRSAGDTMYLAFHYECGTGSGGGGWEIDDVVVRPAEAPVPSLDLAVSPASVEEGAGERAATGTLTLSPAPASMPLRVEITSGDPSLVSLPTELVFDTPGSSSRSFPITVGHDGRHRETLEVSLRAFAPGYLDAEASLRVHNVDPPRPLVLDLTPDRVPEDAGEGAATLVVTLPEEPSTGFPVIVTLSSSDPAVLEFPFSVPITASGTGSVSVPLAVRPDGEERGDRAVSITASAPGFAAASIPLVIADVDGRPEPALALSLLATEIAEGGTGAGRVRLNRPAPSPLMVRLEGSHPSRLEVPAEVLLSPGQEETTFSFFAPRDDMAGPDLHLTIFATAEGWSPAAADLTVRNVDPVRTAELGFRVAAAREGASVPVELVLSPPVEEAVTLRLGTWPDLHLPDVLPLAAGASAVQFEVEVAAGDGFEGPETASLRIQVPGYPAAEAGLEIIEADPRGALVAPGPGKRPSLAETVTLEAVAADPLGTLEGVVFLVDGDAHLLAGQSPFKGFLEPPAVSPQELPLLQEVEAWAVDPVLGDSLLGRVRIAWVFCPVRSDGDFIIQVWRDFAGRDPNPEEGARGLDRLRACASRSAFLIGELEAVTFSAAAEAVELSWLVLGRFPSRAELAAHLPADDPSASEEWVERLLASEDAARRFGVPGGGLGTRDFLPPVWQARHGVPPTPQQLVQAGTRIAELGGRAPFLVALAREEVRPGALDGLIYRPPKDLASPWSLRGLLRLGLWGEAPEDDAPGQVEEALGAEDARLLLDHPRYWERFGYAWLGASPIPEKPGWFRGVWFGDFFQVPEKWPWVYHADHGWIAVGSDDARGGGTWWFDRALGWVWSAEAAYPWLWVHRAEDWFFYLPGSRDPRRFWDRGNALWRAVETD